MASSTPNRLLRRCFGHQDLLPSGHRHPHGNGAGAVEQQLGLSLGAPEYDAAAGYQYSASDLPLLQLASQRDSAFAEIGDLVSNVVRPTLQAKKVWR